VPFVAFRFLTGDGKLYITCDVKVCLTAADCKVEGSTCSPSQTVAVGRKKREAAGTKTVRMGQVVTITTGNTSVTVDNRNDGSSGAQNMKDASECLDNPQMQTVLAVLGLLLVLAVLALTATAVMFCRARNNQDAHVKYVDNYAMGSSTQTLAMPKI